MLRVIGVGSPIGDDRVGLVLIDELKQSAQLQPYLGKGLELLAADRPGAGLLNLFEGAERVFLIDAVVTGADIGRLHHWSDAAEIENSCFGVSSHGFGLAQAVALGRQLNMLPEQLFVFGVEIDAATAGDDLSPPIRSEIGELKRRMLIEILATLAVV